MITAAFTIVAKNYVPYALVLAESFLEHNPNSSFYCVVVDEEVAPSALASKGVKFIGFPSISARLDDFWLMSTMYDVTEFSTSLKPFVLEYLLDDHDVVLYIDPDICVYSDLSSLVNDTHAHGWSLTPHCLAPMQRDGNTPSEADIMQSGIFNLGYIGVSQRALPMLRWWQERLRRDAISDPAKQLFTDQRWIDMAAVLFEPYVERNPAYNVAYWNLDQRPLGIADDVVTVDGNPLKFFHFSGFNPERPWWLSKHHPVVPRNLVSSSDALMMLCDDYGQRVNESQENMGLSTPYRWNEAFPGFSLTAPMRRYFRQVCIDADKGKCEYPPSPFDGDSLKFVSWLQENSPATNLPRFVEVVLSGRPDIQAAFGAYSVEVADRSGLQAWINSTGRAEISWLTIFPPWTDCTVDRDFVDAPMAGKLLPVTRAGVDVVGYLKSEHGVGEAGRLITAALLSAGVETSTSASSRTISRQDAAFDLSGVLDHSIRLLAVNADQTELIATDAGRDELANSYVIGQWFWELEEFPFQFNGAFDVVNEVWAATTFTAESVRSVAPVGTAVTRVPLPLLAPKTNQSLQRADFGLDDRYLFLFSFDMLSVMKRKNPLAVIDAYRNAFNGDGNTQLVIKCMNGSKQLEQLEILRWAARHRSDITVLDNYMTKDDAARLTELADCYVSLHRSEGLGLTMSEAMCLGTPVIATAYSGNMDFMNDDNSILIPWTYVAVGDGAEPYSPTSQWAEPDVDAASKAMRKLSSNESLGRELGARGQQSLAEKFSIERCGVEARKRIEQIQETLG